MASKGHLCSRTCIDYSARIPFVARPNERNVLDQRQLEYELVEKHGIHVIRQTLADRPAELRPSFNQKLLPHQERETHKPSLKERGRECVLVPTQRPAAIVIRRLQQAGYDQADSLAFLGAEDMTFLMKFAYKSQLLGPTVGRPPKKSL
ncbi:hypothetical protein M405DRAFT_870036 [Rhizopogon salebrosus TDB-379]|nr:hypothetical protein M405DRAFT_870036 [Rhizopogon salebrosus TDB-379]